jgi:hypothetical protein
MANCFDTHVGLKGCSTVAPKSGIFVNQLPGLSSELADHLANSEQVTFSGVWKDVLTIAKQNFLNDMVNGLSESINFHQIVYQTKRPRPARTKLTIPAFAEYRGILIEAPESRYSQIRIKSLFVYSATIQTITIKAWNVWDGSQIYTKDVDVVLGFNEIALDIAIDLTFSENSIFIGVDSSTLDTVEFLQEIDNFWSFWGWDDCPYIGGYGGLVGYQQQLRIQAARMDLADTPDYTTVIRHGNPFGVWGQVEVICSSESFLCENIHHFTTAILYLLGYNLLLYKISSPRINFFTYYKEDVTEKLMLEFKSQYASNLKRTLAAIPTDGSGFCFDCENTRQYEIQGSMP